MSASTRPGMTRSPVALARQAYEVARQSLAPYSSRRSRKDFTQAQLFAMLALRRFFKTDYRGTVQLLEDFAELRRLLELKKVPHFTTLQKAEGRLIKKGRSSGSWKRFSSVPGRAA